MSKNEPFAGQLRDFKWLRDVGALDPKSETWLKTAIAEGKRILIIGHGFSGKTTLQNACFHHALSIGRELVTLPGHDGKRLDSFFASRRWKDFSKILGMKYPSVLAVSHHGEPEDHSPWLTHLKSKVDLIVDLRRPTSADRVVYRIYRRAGGAFRVVYQNKKWERHYYLRELLDAA